MPTLASQPPTLHDTIQGFLARQAHRTTPILAQTARQALTLFTTFLRTHLQLHTQRIPVTELRVGWFVDYLHFLQDTRAIETEHLYTRALLDFYAYAAAEIPLGIDLPTLSANLAQNRRPKHHSPLQPPVQIIDTLLATLLAAPLPSASQPDDRDYLRTLRDRAFLLTLAATGLKASEICALRRSHLDTQSTEITLPSNLRLLLPLPTYRAITSYLFARQALDGKQNRPLEDLPLFARHDKRAGQRILPISRWTAANIVNNAMREFLPPSNHSHTPTSDPPITVQTFRHYCVAKTLQRTGDLQETQALARHADPTTTRRYLSAQPSLYPAATDLADGPAAE